MEREQELQRAAEQKYPKRYSVFTNAQQWMDDARRNMINGFIAGAQWEADRDKWIEYHGQEVPAGSYWIVVDGKTQEATVNEKEYAELINQKGFWQHSDCSLDAQAFPSHYMPYVIPTPPAPKTQ